MLKRQKIREKLHRRTVLRKITPLYMKDDKNRNEPLVYATFVFNSANICFVWASYSSPF